MNPIVVVYDGNCELCRNSVHWVSKKLVISAVNFHDVDLAKYNLRKEQCAHEVFVIAGQERFSGARAVAFLLKRRGNKALSAVITISGPLGRIGYKWVASNRSSKLVGVLNKFLKRS